MKKLISLILVISMVAIMFAGCKKNDDKPVTNEPTGKTEVNQGEQTPTQEDKKIAGEITVLTNRTDIVDTVFKEYAAKFNAKFPDVKVKFEAITDYEGSVKIRMNTEDYGDVLLIPNDIPNTELADFFVPLGSIADMKGKYNFAEEKAFDGQVYGLAQTGNANGIVYNKKVFEQAGITKLPSTPEEFINALKQIKEKTDAVPLYTNYAAGWPLVQWEGHVLSVCGDPDYNNKIIHIDAPFAEGEPHQVIYKLMYDVVKEKLVEDDPLTTDWESSKSMLGEGKIATMVLGSWAVTQMQEKATDPNDIGYMPFPSNKNGQIYAEAGGDYKLAVNKNSKNIDAALAWLYWFVEESNYAYDQGGIPTLKGAEFPPTLKAFEDMGVMFVSANPAPESENGLKDEIDNEAEIGLWEPDFKKRLIDSALGNTNETLESIFTDLNARWAKAKAKIMK